MSEKVVKFPLSGKPNEKIDYVSVQVYPSFIAGEGSVELRLDVKTNVNDYHKVEVLPRNIMEAHFDQVFDRAKAEVKRLIISGN